uniref:Uncharacterized protein n=1 Tax=Lepeophtheirus salmonis TaxID=72036 RepID=A0A0K2VJ93_LEPSM
MKCFQRLKQGVCYLLASGNQIKQLNKRQSISIII